MGFVLVVAVTVAVSVCVPVLGVLHVDVSVRRRSDDLGTVQSGHVVDQVVLLHGPPTSLATRRAVRRLHRLRRTGRDMVGGRREELLTPGAAGRANLRVGAVYHLYELPAFEEEQQVLVTLQKPRVKLCRGVDRLAHPPGQHQLQDTLPVLYGSHFLVEDLTRAVGEGLRGGTVTVVDQVRGHHPVG